MSIRAPFGASVLLASWAWPVAAQTSPPTNATEPRPAIFAPPPPAAPAPPKPPVPRRTLLSPEMAQKLSAVAQRATTAPKAGPPTSTPAGPAGDVVQLRPFVVRDRKLPELKERDVLTAQGQLERLRKQHPGLTAAGLADALDAERRREIGELSGMLNNDNVTPEQRREIHRATVRPPEWPPRRAN